MGEETRQVRFRDIGELPPGKFNDVEPCPDCARLRALLGEAIKLLEDAGTAVGTKHTALESKCFALAARIAEELEETK